MSDFMKNIANEAATIPKQEPVKELDILSRSARPNIPDVEEIVNESEIVIPEMNAGDPTPRTEETTKPINIEEAESVQDTKLIMEQMANNIQRLEAQLNKVVELAETNKKYPFPEGATATNHSTNKQIVFSQGQWWYLDAKK